MRHRQSSFVVGGGRHEKLQEWNHGGSQFCSIEENGGDEGGADRMLISPSCRSTVHSRWVCEAPDGASVASSGGSQEARRGQSEGSAKRNNGRQ